jgi:hypothetical protein
MAWSAGWRRTATAATGGSTAPRHRAPWLDFPENPMRPILPCVLLMMIVAPAAKADILAGRFGDPGTTPANVIGIFSDDATGDTAPAGLLGGPAAGLETANGLSYHPDDQTLLVADFYGQRVAVFDAYARGNAAPLRTFSSPAMGQPRHAVAVPGHDEIAVVSFAFIQYYPRNADGSTAPLRSSTFTPGVVDNLSSLVYLTASDEVAVGDGYTPTGGGSAGEVLFFDRLLAGAAVPTRRIAGPSTRLGTFVLGLAHDPVAGELFVLAGNADGSASIQVFPESASGDVAPLRSIEGPDTLMVNVAGLAYYAARDELLVASGAYNAVPRLLGFPRLASGNLTPSRNISGPATGVTAGNGWYSVAGVPSDLLFGDGFD